jgi:hypothetical protein
MYNVFDSAKCDKWVKYSHLAGALHDLVEDLPQAEQVHETVGAGHRPDLSTAAAHHSVLHPTRHPARHSVLHPARPSPQLLLVILSYTQLVTQLVIQLVI